MKACTRCGVLKPFERFCRHPATRDGLQTQCKDCQRLKAHQREPLVRVCVCGQSFVKAAKNQRYCSDACGEARLRSVRLAVVERGRVAREARPPSTCEVCGVLYPPRQRPSRTCSASRCIYKLAHLAKYGLTPASLREMIASQGDRCAACGGGFKERGPIVDHCHETGRVRGILCTNCNIALGHTHDDVERQFALGVYLARAEFDLRDLCAA